MALHVTAAILRSELGADEAHAHRIASAGAATPRLARIGVRSEGFATEPPLPADPQGTVAAAIRGGRRALALPDAVALPVLTADGLGGVIELVGLQLAIDGGALETLLERARAALADVAAREPRQADVATADLTAPAKRHILLVQEGQDDALATALRRLGLDVQRARAESGPETQCDLVLVDVDSAGSADARPATMASSRIPRLAVSWRGRPEDEALYLQRGFDAYLCNPLVDGRLVVMLNRWLGALHCAAADESAGGAARLSGVRLDAAALRRLADLDPKGESRLIERVLKAYQTSMARLMPQFEQGRLTGNTEVMRQVAHTLKSSSAAIGAVKFSQLCAEIETMIRSNRTEGLAARAAVMGDESAFVLEAVKELLDSGP
ncbi:MAG: Hpt domain-containing protein [Proteobacteria bacterium]|nr:Hpt domain-containing protein [Pseudomonadota bacterium]